LLVYTHIIKPKGLASCNSVRLFNFSLNYHIFINICIIKSEKVGSTIGQIHVNNFLLVASCKSYWTTKCTE
jgi:hypothetical protein